MNRNDPNPLLDQLQVLRKEYRDRIWTSGISLRELLLERERISPSGGRVVEIDAAFEQAQSIVESPVCPIVAVLGMLNAGKSSLVATYLNADGNSGVRRVLIGSANTEGTHRFVLWLPESWKSNSVIWGYLSRRLSEVFGCKIGRAHV